MSTLRTIVLSVVILALLAYGLPVSDSLAARWRTRKAYLTWRAKHLRHRHTRVWWRKHDTYARRQRARARVLSNRRKARRIDNAATATKKPQPGVIVSARRAETLKPRVSNAALSVTNVATSNSAPAFSPAPTATNTSLPLVARERQAVMRPDAEGAQANVGAPRRGMARQSKRQQVSPSLSSALQDPRGPYELTLPAAWSSAGATRDGEMRFNVRSLDGQQAGSAVLAPVGQAVPANVPSSPRARSLGGVPLAALRRTVIDRMVNDGGWVVNDFEREMQGRRVYVVVAQVGGAGGPQRNLTFYFTEVNGRLYRLSTNASPDSGDTVAAASERVVSTFRVGGQQQNVAARAPEE